VSTPDRKGEDLMRIPLPQAAEKLGMPADTLRHFLREGKFDFGEAVKRKRWTYYINGRKLDQYLGRDYQ
jgi:hypothetical protein